MTKKKFYVGTLAIALLFALMLAGCDNGTTNNDTNSNDTNNESVVKTTLTAGEWANGNITSSGGEQWFTFTATGSPQYIHVNFGSMTELYIQLYDSEDKTVGEERQLSRSNTYFSTAVTSGKVYSIKVRPGSSTLGTYQIMFNDSITTPLITLTANVWANGNIPTPGGEQWFKFTATAVTQYIHADFGTLTNLYIQLYDSEGNTVGIRTNLYNTSRYAARTLTIGQVYRIKITPYSSSGSGTYQIAFNDSTTPPPVTLPSNAIQLTGNVWADGNISTSDGEQWFKFTATAELLQLQYIHVNFRTLTDLYIQLYDNNGNAVGSQTHLYTSSTIKYTNRSLTKGQVYYIKVTLDDTKTGTYQIAFNDSTTPPPATLPSNAIQLSPNVFVDGFISTSNGEQWFKFTATAEVQYIHTGFGSLTSLYIQLYNKDGNTVGDRANLSTYATVKYISRPLTIGQEYYIKVTPYSSSGGGTYQIGFNTSTTAPTIILLPANAAQLTLNVRSDGNITESNGIEWFKFTATATTHYIHVGFGTLTDLYIQLYNSEGNTVGDRTELYTYSSTPGTTRNISRTGLTAGQEYYIKVTPYSSSGSGTYQIGFNSSTVAPPSNVTRLAAANVWTDGNISTAGAEQWFKFTATAGSHYIHANFGTLTNLSIQLYDGENNAVGTQTQLINNTKYISRTGLTAGQEYYIRITPYYSSGTNSSGTYQIGFNTTETAPPITLPTNAIQLTLNVRSDGNIPTAGGQQWFKFTATAVSHYIHVGFGTLNDLHIQLYDNGGNTVGGQTELYGSTTYILRGSLTTAQEYYIKVTPYSSSYTGTYQIAFNTSTASPPITLPANAIQLTLNVRSDGNITTAGGEQWFKFTATATTHYIHVGFGTMTSLYIQLYNNEGNTVGDRTNLSSTLYYSYASQTGLTAGQEYHIKVTPYSSSGTGTYHIAFNTSTAAPPISLPANATQLTLNVRSDGNISTAGGEQWFKFTATATIHYIHASLGTLNDLYIQLYDNGGNTVGNQTEFWSSTYTQRTGLTAGQEYHIKITPYNSSGTNSSGTYQIAFNTSTATPLPSNAIQLTAEAWAEGNILTAGGEQWFKFTATAAAHYIHINFGTLNDLYVQLYNSGGNTVGGQTNIFNTTTYAQQTGLTIGQEYHIKVTPYSSSSGTGTYQIAFNTSTTAP